MSINATTSSSAQVSSSSSVSSSTSTDTAKKSSSESSFKDEMDKVSSQEQKASENNASEKKDSVSSEKKNDEKTEVKKGEDIQLEGNVDYSDYASISVLDVNSMLAKDIRQIMGLSAVEGFDGVFGESGFLSLDFTKTLSMTASDAEFFIGLTQNNDISMANITAQAQVMLNNGADVAEVRQNVQISQTLLNAINNARETNQPLRIDFGQDVAVILRINKEGVISANFIPGDKAVEQYLKNNISSLRSSFEEKELPYSDLSYSNRGSKQQKENRRNNK